ncbi:hypothetical protein ADK74_17860 [Streptomyces decoyicus]|nr:hypothetical protein ADK74_17860 [Streptomyces decoyicus]
MFSWASFRPSATFPATRVTGVSSSRLSSRRLSDGRLVAAPPDGRLVAAPPDGRLATATPDGCDALSRMSLSFPKSPFARGGRFLGARRWAGRNGRFGYSW